MKILIIHYRYLHGSGPESYLFNVTKLLEQHGHEVIPFSINYSNNVPTKYSKYFIDPVGGKDQFNLFLNDRLSIGDKLTIVKNLFFNKEAYKAIENLVWDTKPDIAYVLQYWGKLSVSVIHACVDLGLPVFLRCSDYGMVCAKNIFFRDGNICTKCIKSQAFAVRYKCVQNSYIKSLLNYFALRYSYRSGFHKKVAAIVAPSIMMQKMLKSFHELHRSRIIHVPTFISEGCSGNEGSNRRTIEYRFCYIGRIAEDKGLIVMVRALLRLKEKGLYPETIIVGEYENEYGNGIKDLCKDNDLMNVYFTGFLDRKSVLSIVGSSGFCIVPSLWFDNMPNSIIESQAMGVPTIASDIGSLPEMIENGKNGYLFKPGDDYDLAEKMELALNMNHEELNSMHTNSLEFVKKNCSAERHYTTLLGAFESVTHRGAHEAAY